MKDLTQIPTADLLSEIKRRIEGDTTTPTIALQYHRLVEEYLTEEDKELLLSFVNQPQEVEHIGSFNGSPKVLTVEIVHGDKGVRIGSKEDEERDSFYLISAKYTPSENSQDQRLREYAKGNALKRFTPCT